jgi:hypothetical protein
MEIYSNHIKSTSEVIKGKKIWRLGTVARSDQGFFFSVEILEISVKSGVLTTLQ